MRGLEIAKSLGHTGCMVEGNPDAYRRKMGFLNYRSFGIECDDSVDNPDGCVHAIELVPGGFDKTNKLLSYSYYDLARNETLVQALCKMLGINITDAEYKTKQLHGGTLGDVRLVIGTAETADGEKLPYKVVLKIQKNGNATATPFHGAWSTICILRISALCLLTPSVGRNVITLKWGFSKYLDVSHIADHCVRELIPVMFGYRIVEWFKFAKPPDDKTFHLDTLQKIFEIGECK